MEEFSPFWSVQERQARSLNPRIAFSDSTDPRVLAAARALIDRKILQPILVGDEKGTNEIARQNNLPGFEKACFISDFNKDQDSLLAAVEYLKSDKVEGVVGGSLRPTSDVVRAALKGIGPRPGVRLVAGHFWIESTERKTTDKGPFLFADCAVMPEPSAIALATIAVEASRAYRFFAKADPRVAFLSFSTKGSAEHLLVDRIRQAVAAVRKMDASITVDGEIQVDAALEESVADIKKAGDSPIAGKANVLIFPTLEAGNIGYKLVQRFSKTRIAGPLLWGLNKPMSDLSRGCTIQEVVDTAALVAAMVRR